MKGKKKRILLQKITHNISHTQNGRSRVQKKNMEQKKKKRTILLVTL